MIINLTQHYATDDQKEEGVSDLPRIDKELVRECLTFNDIPTKGEVVKRATWLADLAHELKYHSAMIGGAPYLMAELEKALLDRGIRPLYAFSTRESVEETFPDGSVRKVNVFKHVGFVGKWY